MRRLHRIEYHTVYSSTVQHSIDKLSSDAYMTAPPKPQQRRRRRVQADARFPDRDILFREPSGPKRDQNRASD
jgi:hypothetical protein